MVVPISGIVFTALAVSHAIQSRTGLSIRKVVKQPRPLRRATISINGTTQTFPPAIPAAPSACINQRTAIHRTGVTPANDDDLMTQDHLRKVTSSLLVA